MTDHAPVFRYGTAWCNLHDRRWARCDLEAALAEPPAGCEDLAIESTGNACWVACSCGTVGPRRTGDAETAWLMAAIDRATHLAGGSLDPAPPVLPPTAEPGPTQELLYT